LTPTTSPLRVDFAGGWLDVPKFAIEGGYIVNCAVSPLVSLMDWPYEQNSGMGGSAAWAHLNGKNGVESELDMGVGWQDPAIVKETGVCVWSSGPKPRLECKRNPDWLVGRMALLFTNRYHVTADIVNKERPWDLIKEAGREAKKAVDNKDINLLAEAISISYDAQLSEGMDVLPVFGEIARKFCGSGWGGYALYLFKNEKDRDKFLQESDTLKIEPYIN